MASTEGPQASAGMTQRRQQMQSSLQRALQNMKVLASPLQGIKLPSPPLQSLKLPSPLLQGMKLPSFSFSRRERPPARPLLDIEDVRAFIRSKLGPPKPSSSHGDSKRVSSGVFGIGTMGTSSSEGGYVPLSSSHTHEQPGQISSHPPVHASAQHHHDHQQDGHGHHNGHHDDYHNHLHHDQNEHGPQQHHHHDHHQEGHPPSPLLDLDDIREVIESFLHHTGFRPRPTTSWQNKMPWHVPRASFLAKGLQWPPDSFESEEQRKEFNRKARKRKPFLMGSPPLWTVTVFNLAFFQFLMYNPLYRFFAFLKKLP